jgi:hypothetical protein
MEIHALLRAGRQLATTVEDVMRSCSEHPGELSPDCPDCADLRRALEAWREVDKE